MSGSFLERRSLGRNLFEMMLEFCVEIPGVGDRKCKGPVVDIDLTFLRNVCKASRARVEEKRSS